MKENTVERAVVNGRCMQRGPQEGAARVAAADAAVWPRVRLLVPPGALRARLRAAGRRAVRHLHVLARDRCIASSFSFLVALTCTY